jgi:putative ABC transport system permease protein
MIDSLSQDCRFAWRGLLRSPGFAAFAIGTLALGIGANSAIFTVVNAIVMRPLPYPNADRLVRITADWKGLNATDVGLSQPELVDYRDRSGLFESVAGVLALNGNLTEIDQPERVEALLASPSYFEVRGVRPQLGRVFGPEDSAPGITEVLVISDALWRRRFGASPSALGRTLRLDNDWYTVVGVLPPDFRHPGRSVLTDVDVWAPANFAASPFPKPPGRRAYFLTGAVARLAPGTTIDQARERLAAFGQGLRAAYPDDYPLDVAWAPRVVPLQDDLVGSVKPALLMLSGAVGFVLLIACANMANLLLARASTRQRELAVRRALGSSRRRLVRLMLTESLMLSALGGVAGIALTIWLVDGLIAMAPAGLPRIQEIAINRQVFVFTALVTLATSVVFGTTPAVQYSRTDVTDAFATLALLLAAIGIYGVMAVMVRQRTREIGIRIALGANPRSVVRLVLGQALTLAAAGAVVGAAAAVLVARLLSGLLFEVRATDPATYMAIALLLGATAAIAAWRPARRAASVDPISALRAE